MKFMMIDTHCHLSKDDYSNLEEIIHHMDGNIMIISGADMKMNYEVVELCQKYSNIYGTLGIHPENPEEYTLENKNWIKEQAKNPKIIGIGEIGLDYHYGKENREKQIEIFLDQIELAKSLNLPIIIHSRDADQETFDLLKEHAKRMKFHLHCYSGSAELAKEYLKIGAKFGIGGVVTFKNGRRLQEVVKEVPLTSLLLETDSPYLSPEPFRGHQNEPYNILYVAKKIAEIKEIPFEKVIEQTNKNSISQFDLPIHL